MTAAKKIVVKFSPRGSKVVDAALVLDDISTFHHIGMQPREFVEFAKKAPVYNNLRRGSFVKLAKFINDCAPRMDFGGENVNNGQHFVTLRVGNEGSRVVYLDIDRFYANNKAQLEEFLSGLIDASKEANVDEFNMDPGSMEAAKSVGGGRTITVRMWWD